MKSKKLKFHTNRTRTFKSSSKKKDRILSDVQMLIKDWHISEKDVLSGNFDALNLPKKE